MNNTGNTNIGAKCPDCDEYPSEGEPISECDMCRKYFHSRHMIDTSLYWRDPPTSAHVCNSCYWVLQHEKEVTISGDLDDKSLNKRYPPKEK